MNVYFLSLFMVDCKAKSHNNRLLSAFFCVSSENSFGNKKINVANYFTNNV